MVKSSPVHVEERLEDPTPGASTEPWRTRRAVAWIYSPTLIWTLVAVAILLRFVQYLSNPSVWMDEAFIALNIAHQPLFDLWEPLNNLQSAPLGFLFAEKGVVEVIGNNEYALRLIPLASSVASVFLFLAVARRWLGREALVAALALFAMTTPLLIYAAQTKQYSGDVAVALLIYLAAIWAWRTGWSLPRSAAFGAVGAVAVWLSHPAVFVLSAVAVAIAVTPILRREWRSLYAVAVACVPWIVSLAVSYFSSQEQVTRVQEATDSIEPSGASESFARQDPGGFMPFPPSPSTVSWLGDKAAEITHDSLGSHRTLTGALAVVALAGLVSLFRRERDAALMLALPIPLVLAASAIEKYPVGGRFLLFLVPSLLLILAEGAVAAVRDMRRGALLGMLLATVVLVPPAVSAAKNVADPWTRQEMKPMLEHLQERQRKGDALYLHYPAQYAFRYYWERGLLEKAGDESASWAFVPLTGGREQYAPVLGSRSPRVVVGQYDPLFLRYVAEIERLRENDRVWVMIVDFAGSPDDEPRLLVRYLDSIGTRQESLHEAGISLFLYDLTRRG
jgi:hypothetical protein